MAALGPSKAALTEKSEAAFPEKAPLEATAESRSIMATIQDDDERLLARIGYKQACSKPNLLQIFLLTVVLGAEARIHKMVDYILRHFYSRSAGISARNLRKPYHRWRAGHGCMGVVYRIVHGNVHCKLRSVASESIHF